MSVSGCSSVLCEVFQPVIGIVVAGNLRRAEGEQCARFFTAGGENDRVLGTVSYIVCVLFVGIKINIVNVIPDKKRTARP